MRQLCGALAAAAVLVAAAPAFAEGPASQPAKAPSAAKAVKHAHHVLPAAHKCGVLSSCGYHRVLGYLVITHDMAVPGAPDVAIRLLPTAHSLAGDSSKPIVVRPVVHDGSYGLDIAARF